MQKGWNFAVKSKQTHPTSLCHVFNDKVVYLLILFDPTIPHLGVYPIATLAHMQNDVHTGYLFVIANHWK